MTDKQSKRQKYVSLRKALRELKVNEDDFKKMVEKGYIHPIYEGEEAKFNPEEIFKISQHRKVSGEGSGGAIDDEELYKSADMGIYDSLFLTGTHEVAAGLNIAQPPKSPDTDSPHIDIAEKDRQRPHVDMSDSERTKKRTDELQMQVVKEAVLERSPEVHIPEPTMLSRDRRRRISAMTVAGFLEKMRRIPPHWIAILAIALALFFSSGKTAARVPNPSVRIARVQNGDFVAQFMLSGKVIAARETQVYAHLDGFIDKIYHSEGASLKQGDIIAEISSPSLDSELEMARVHLWKTRLELEQATLDVQYAQKNMSAKDRDSFHKFKELLEKQNPGARDRLAGDFAKLSLAEKNLYVAELRCQTASQELEIAGKTLEERERDRQFLTVRSPGTGILLRQHMALQMRVGEATLLAVIANPSQKLIEAKLPGNCDIVKGASAEIEIYGREKNLTGTVVYVSHLREGPRTLQLDLPDTADIPFGTDATIKFSLPTKASAVQAPKASVIFPENSPSPVVFWATLEEENIYRIHSLPIKTGMSNAEFYEVLEGLSGQELVVTGCQWGMRALYDEMIVPGVVED